MNEKTKSIFKSINRVFYIAGIAFIAFAMLLSTINFPVNAEEWDNATLTYKIGCDGNCRVLRAKICNFGTGNMAAPGVFEVYFSSNGDPRNGSLVYTGSFPALAVGECALTEFYPENASGNYIFKAYQTPGFPGPIEIWSNSCSITCGLPTPTRAITLTATPTVKFTLTNTPTFTATPEDPTPTFTSTPQEPTPTFTSTPQEPTPTFTSTPQEPTPTFTSTPQEPTPTFTSTPQEPTPTFTSTPQEPTPTFTSTPQEPTATPQDPTPTPQEPTSTPQEPTLTPQEPTATPQEPTATPQDPTPTPQGPTPTGAVTTQAPTLPPPPVLDTPSVLIPVTGADLSPAGKVRTVKDTLFNLGLGLLGFGFVFTGIRRRFGL